MKVNLLKLWLGLWVIASFWSFSYAQKSEDKGKSIKKRVAVFVFEDKTDRRYYWWNRKSVGEGISDMLTTALVKSGNYRVIERQELNLILQEQDLGAAGIVTAQSAAQMGKVLGVELAVMGSVSEFGYKKSDVGGRLKRFGLGVQTQTAVVGLDCRLVNTTSGEIIASESVRKEKSAKGIKVATDKIDFRSRKAFDESLVGKAVRDAVNEVVALINQNAKKIPWQAKVITVKNGLVFINAGSNSGVNAGDTFVIYRKGEELIDPDTGLSLGSIDTKIGEIKVINAEIGEGKASQCSILSGSGFQKGDFVRLE
jgi:curli biogenesis system outer membrane secretion channel CsgG